MATGINKVIIIGNLGGDPEVRYTPNGTPITTVSVATTENWRDKQSGELQERTEWHRVVFFMRLAEIASEYLHKGSKIYVEGNLRTRKWEKNGIERYTTEIVAREMQMLDRRNSNIPPNNTSNTSSRRKPPVNNPAIKKPNSTIATPADSYRNTATSSEQAMHRAATLTHMEENSSSQQTHSNQKQTSPANVGVMDDDDDIPF